jgi:hypothetical protein
MWNSRVRPGIGVAGWLVSAWLTVTATVSATLANIILISMAVVSLWTFWPWLKRWRPWTLVPADGKDHAAKTPDPVLAQLRDRNEQLDQLNETLEVERDQLSDLLQDTKRENRRLKQQDEELALTFDALSLV